MARRLRSALERHGLDTSLPNFAQEFRSVFAGEEIQHLYDFFNRNVDLPLSDVFRLCDAIKLPAAEIFDTSEDREHLQIYDYLGGSMVNVFLPPGLIWDRQAVDSLFYYPLGGQPVPPGFSAGDFLIFSRMTLNPTPGRVYLVENNQAHTVRYCVAGPTSDFLGFTPNPAEVGSETIFLRRPDFTGDQSNGFASVTGSLVWRVTGAPPSPPTARESS